MSRGGIPGFSLKSNDKKRDMVLLVYFRLCLESRPTLVLIICYVHLLINMFMVLVSSCVRYTIKS